MTVSQSSYNDIVEYFPYAAQKIVVSKEGVDYSLREFRDVDPAIVYDQFDIISPMILSAATFGKHKNMPRLVRAFSRVLKVFPDYKLSLTGGANTKDATIEREYLDRLVKRLDIQESVLFTGYISTQLLAAFYRSASIYVMPSLYEGFGLSVLEAQYFEVPVVCSNIPSLVEVGGRGVFHVNPLDEFDIAQGIIYLLSNPIKRNQLITLGKDNLKKYDWER